MKHFLALAVLLASFAVARGGLERDFGDHIAYIRIGNVGTEFDLVTKALAQASGIVDFRYTTASPQALDEFASLLNRPESRPVKLRIFLINEDTEPRLREIVSRPRARQLTIGPARASLKVDLAVTTSAEEQRLAFDALAQGTAWEKLVTSNLEKRRFDEAALARSHAGGGSPSNPRTEQSDEVETVDNANQPSSTDEKEAPTAPPLDYVLQRAFQLQKAAPLPPK